MHLFHWFFVLSVSLNFVLSSDLKTLTIESTSDGEEIFQADVTDHSSRNILENVIIKEGVTILGSKSFYDYSVLKSALLPYGMTLIKTEAFYQCGKLESIVLPEKLQQLQSSAFRSCVSLQNVTIPSTLQSISSSLTFYADSSLKRFLIPKPNNVFTTNEDGSVLIKDGNIAFLGTCASKTIRIPDNVTSIASCFFNGIYSAVTGIDFGTAGKLRIINKDAFRQTRIASVTFPEGLEYIYGNPFNGIASIEYMSFPSTLIEYGDVFNTVPKEVDISEGCNVLKKDESGVIYNHNYSSIVLLPESLKSFTIPLTVTVVNLPQLRSMESLEKINVTFNHSMYSSYKGVLYDADQKEILAVPGGMKNVSISPSCEVVAGFNKIVENVIFEGTNVTTISVSAFSSTTKLTHLELPDSITTINGYAMTSSSISSIHFPNQLSTLSVFTFNSCKLSSADMRNCSNLTTISNSAFVNCWMLTTVWLPPSLIYLGASCFERCSKLEEVILPRTLETLSISCFSGCTSLSKISINSDLIKEFSIDVFKGCSFASISVPDSIESILQGAFEGNKELQLINFTTSSKLKYIQISAFKECNSIETIHIMKNVENIAIGALSQMYGLTCIKVDEENPHFSSVDGILFDKEGLILKVFPSGIKSFTVKGNIQKIAEKSFYECILLETLKFEDVQNLQSFGEYTFSGCSKLSSIQIPNCVNEIQSFCFSSCSNLSTVIFADGSQVSTLNSGVFDQCKSLETISFGDGSMLTSIEEEVFSGCRSLKFFDFPPGLARIGRGSFRDCSSLINAFLSETQISAISSECFKGCTSLAKVTLPLSLIDLGVDSFSGCISISSIFYCGAELFSNSAFSGVKINVDVSVVYPYSLIGGLDVNKILDKDCQYPTILFTSYERMSVSVIAVGNLLLDVEFN